MGATVNISCKKCGYHRQFFVGAGFNYDYAQIFYGKMPLLRIMVKNPEDRVNIRGIITSQPNAEVLCSDARIYYCSYCGELHENYYFRITYGDEEYLPSYYCSRCETSMEMLNTNWLTTCTNEPWQFFNYKGQPIVIHCPDCNSGEAECKDGNFDWD